MGNFRLYYWILGVPPTRQGGPWWAMDFESEIERAAFLRDVRDLLYAYSRTTTERPLGSARHAITPPKGAIVLKRESIDGGCWKTDISDGGL